jgi:hypothetical protein
MFKKIQSGLAKFFTKDKTTIVMWALLLIILVGALYTYNNGKLLVRDNMETGVADEKKVKVEEPKKEGEGEVKPNDAPVLGYEMQNVANPADLLPKDENSKFAELNPNVMTAEGVAGGDMLEAGYHIGLDSVGQTLRNANLQLRSDPVIAKKDVGPWMTSTIEPDLARTPLELGER